MARMLGAVGDAELVTSGRRPQAINDELRSPNDACIGTELTRLDDEVSAGQRKRPAVYLCSHGGEDQWFDA